MNAKHPRAERSRPEKFEVRQRVKLTVDDLTRRRRSGEGEAHEIHLLALSQSFLKGTGNVERAACDWGAAIAHIAIVADRQLKQEIE